jgi:hypothetical protein
MGMAPHSHASQLVKGQLDLRLAKQSTAVEAAQRRKDLGIDQMGGVQTSAAS